ncbi:universal stress protein [Natronoarchaeum mannanilyticum]|uniref:universal stress protein n=1 Tax=Natronoarchaeum mannanilyticum TaxID=926360 RepID=UPI003620620F
MTDDTVLVALIGRPFDADALARATERFPDAELVVLAVVTPLDAPFSEGQLLSPTDDRFLQARRRAENLVERVRESSGAGDASLDDVEIAVAQGRPAPVVANRAERLDVDRIVVGARDQSRLADYLLVDGVGDAIADRASVPVTVVEVDQATPSPADSTL